jgi:FPC/CPF motif-containing protein YcgG
MVEKIPNGTVYRPSTPNPEGGVTFSDGRKDYPSPKWLAHHKAGMELLFENAAIACPTMRAVPHNTSPEAFFGRLRSTGDSVPKILPRRAAASCFGEASQLLMIDPGTGKAHAANGTGDIPQAHIDAVNKTSEWMGDAKKLSCVPGKIGQFTGSHVFGVYDKPLNHPDTIKAIRRDMHEFRKYQDECYYVQNYYPSFVAIILPGKAYPPDETIPREFSTDKVDKVALHTNELVDFGKNLSREKFLPEAEASGMDAEYLIDELGAGSPRAGRHSPYMMVNFLPREAFEHFGVTGQLEPFRTYSNRQEKKNSGSAIRPFGHPLRLPLSRQSSSNTLSAVSESLQGVARGAAVNDTYAMLLFYKLEYVKQLPLSEQYAAFSVIADNFRIFEKYKEVDGIYSENGAHLFLHAWARKAHMKAEMESQSEIGERFESKLREFELAELARKNPLAHKVAQIAAIAGPEFDEDLVSRMLLSPSNGVTKERLAAAMGACRSPVLDEQSLNRRGDRAVLASMSPFVKGSFSGEPRIDLDDDMLEFIESGMSDQARDELSRSVSRSIGQRKQGK